MLINIKKIKMEPIINQQMPMPETKNKTWLWLVIIILVAGLVSAGVYYWQNMKAKKMATSAEEKVRSEMQIKITEAENRTTDLGNKLIEQQKTIETSINKFTLINDRCTAEECLFNNNSNYPMGTAVIKGYYSSVERTAWDVTKKCDGFTITGGSQEIIRAMTDLVDKGNTVHSKNALNQPVINLGLSSISQQEKQTILNSNIKRPIELLIFVDSPVEVGVPVCFEDATVLKINN